MSCSHLTASSVNRLGNYEDEELWCRARAPEMAAPARPPRLCCLTRAKSDATLCRTQTILSSQKQQPNIPRLYKATEANCLPFDIISRFQSN